MTTLPRDTDNTPIPALRLNPTGAHSLAVTSTSARNATAFGDETRIISLYATADIYVAFGDSTVTASTTDHFFPGGLYYDIAIGGDKTLHTPYVAAIAAGADATLYMSEKA